MSYVWSRPKSAPWGDEVWLLYPDATDALDVPYEGLVRKAVGQLIYEGLTRRADWAARMQRWYFVNHAKQDASRIEAKDLDEAKAAALALFLLNQ